MSVSPLLSVYRLATRITAGVMPFWLNRRATRDKEDPSRMPERYGISSVPRPQGTIIWCHAASVGETMSVLPLLEALTQRGASIVLTTGTVTAARLVRQRAAAGIIHQFAPLDHSPWIKRFLDHWRPALALRVDSDLWPNTLMALRDHHVPVIQINARMSARAYQNWSRIRPFVQDVFHCFDLVCAQSINDQHHYENLGAQKVVLSGNLKLSQAPLPFETTALEKLKSDIHHRPTWTAASIHPGEEHIIGTAHVEIRAHHPTALVIVVPRHPERAPDMIQRFRALGLTVAQRSQSETIAATTDVYMADTMGELGLVYRASPIVVMGKSFAVGGGQNPAEAAQIGCGLIWGPDMTNFSDIASDLEARGAAIKVSDAAELARNVIEMMSDPARSARMADQGRAYISENATALPQTMDVLAPYLEQLSIS